MTISKKERFMLPNGNFLSPTERDTFDLRALGYTSYEIALLRGKSRATVKNQSSNVLKKIEARNMAHAVFKMAKWGLLLTLLAVVLMIGVML